MNLARSVRCHDDERRSRGFNRAQLRYPDGKQRKFLQQEGLKIVIRAVDLVDKQHAWRRFEGLQNGARLQEISIVQGAL